MGVGGSTPRFWDGWVCGGSWGLDEILLGPYVLQFNVHCICLQEYEIRTIFINRFCIISKNSRDDTLYPVLRASVCWTVKTHVAPRFETTIIVYKMIVCLAVVQLVGAWLWVYSVWNNYHRYFACNDEIRANTVKCEWPNLFDRTLMREQWLIGRFDVFSPTSGRRFESRSSRHVGTLIWQVLHSQLPVVLRRVNSDAVSVLCRESFWVVVKLKKRYRNILNEWMNDAIMFH